MQRRAFTLLELVLVLAVLGVLSAVAAARLTGLRDSQEVEMAAQRTAQQAGRARHLAVSRGVPVRLRLDPDELTCAVNLLRDGQAGEPDDGHPATIALRQSAGTVAADFVRNDGEPVAAGPVDIVFWPDARAEPAGTLTIANASRSAAVALSGGVRAAQVEVRHAP